MTIPKSGSFHHKVFHSRINCFWDLKTHTLPQPRVTHILSLGLLELLLMELNPPYRDQRPVNFASVSASSPPCTIFCDFLSSVLPNPVLFLQLYLVYDSAPLAFFSVNDCFSHLGFPLETFSDFSGIFALFHLGLYCASEHFRIYKDKKPR